MWMEKLSVGVLRVLTPLGPRYLRPSFGQRVYLLWIFRNFPILPLQVLNPRQRKLVDDLCVEQHFVSVNEADGWDVPILGTVERRPPVEVETQAPRRPSSRVSDSVSPLAADAQQRP
jgi:hypothetical protein